jgi:hypothetical protein
VKQSTFAVVHFFSTTSFPGLVKAMLSGQENSLSIERK